MRAVLLLNKVNLNEENVKKNTLQLIRSLFSITNLEVYLTKNTSEEEFNFIAQHIDKKKIRKLTSTSIFPIYLKYEFIFTTSHHNNILSQLNYLPKKAFKIKVYLDEIKDQQETDSTTDTFDLTLTESDLFLNLHILEKIMKAKTKKFTVKTLNGV